MFQASWFLGHYASPEGEQLSAINGFLYCDFSPEKWEHMSESLASPAVQNTQLFHAHPENWHELREKEVGRDWKNSS